MVCVYAWTTRAHTSVDTHTHTGKLNYVLPKSFETIRCAKCTQTSEARARVSTDVKKFLKRRPRWHSNDEAAERAMFTHLDEEFPVTTKFKIVLGGEAGKGKGGKGKLSGVDFEPRAVEVLTDGESGNGVWGWRRGREGVAERATVCHTHTNSLTHMHACICRRVVVSDSDQE